MPDPVPTSTTSTAAATSPANAATTSVSFTADELSRYREALKAKVAHHGKLAINATLISAERDRHAALKTSYATDLAKVETMLVSSAAATNAAVPASSGSSSTSAVAPAAASAAN